MKVDWYSVCSVCVSQKFSLICGNYRGRQHHKRITVICFKECSQMQDIMGMAVNYFSPLVICSS